MQDNQGNRFTPSHTVKNGKRYRYYICRPKLKELGSAAHRVSRLPAHEIEKQVSVRLQSFLQSTQQVLDELILPEDASSLAERLMSASLKRASEWSSAPPAEVQEFVRRVLRRVVVHTDRVEIQASKRELRAALTDGHLASSDRTQSERKEESSSDLILLEVEARLKRCGREMRLLIPPDQRSEARPQLVAPLLKAVARAHEWHEWVLAGKALNQRSIAKKLGINERYVGRVLECAFLAPDIVQAILDGRQPPDLTFAKLTRHVPLSWVDQREQLGFPSLATRR